MQRESALCHRALATCVEWMELCPCTAAEGKSFICLTLTVHPGAFVGGVDDLFVDLLVTAIAADTLSVKPSQSKVGAFTTCGAT